MAFTFAAFCYMLALLLTAALIFFAIWHVSSRRRGRAGEGGRGSGVASSCSWPAVGVATATEVRAGGWGGAGSVLAARREVSALRPPAGG